jgi:hypothetical protein
MRTVRLLLLHRNFDRLRERLKTPHEMRGFPYRTPRSDRAGAGSERFKDDPLIRCQSPRKTASMLLPSGSRTNAA